MLRVYTALWLGTQGLLLALMVFVHLKNVMHDDNHSESGDTPFHQLQSRCEVMVRILDHCRFKR